MLIIRDAQLRLLLEAPRESYFLRLERQAHALFPERVAEIGNEETRALVRRVAEAAESSGFTTERQAWQAVNLYFLLGPDFEERVEMEWIMDILGDTTRPADERIDAVYVRLAEGQGGASE